MFKPKIVPAFLIISLLVPVSLYAETGDSQAISLPTAHSAFVIDAANDQVLFARSPHEKMAPASTTKLISALVILDTLPMDRVITVPSSVEKTEPTQIHLHGGERFYVRDLLRAILIKSANDAAKTLAIACAGSEYAFAQKMNQKAEALGLHDSKFQNASGLPAEDHYSTVYDLVELFQAAEKSDFLIRTLGTKAMYITSLNGRRIFLKNHNKMLWSERKKVIGKTGWTRNAKHCFVGFIQSGNRKIYVAVLGSKKKWKDLHYFSDRFLRSAAPNSKSQAAVKDQEHYNIRLVQTALKRAGFFKREPTGYFGPITRRALIRFQKAHHLNPDGMMGKEAWQALNRYL